MPYHLEKATGGSGGWYVVGPSGRKSNQPLSHERAVRQMRALYANEPGIAHAQKGGIVTMTTAVNPTAGRPSTPSSKDQMKGSGSALPEHASAKGSGRKVVAVNPTTGKSASMSEQMQGSHVAVGTRERRKPMNQKQRRAAESNVASEPDADDVPHYLTGGTHYLRGGTQRIGSAPPNGRVATDLSGTARDRSVTSRMPARTPMNQKQRRAALSAADDTMPPVMALRNKPPMMPAGGVPGARNGNFFIAKAVGGNKGKFRAKAQAAGKTTAAYAEEKKDAPGTLGKEARLAKTLMGMHK